MCKELVDMLCEQGHPEALAFRAFIESIKAKSRQVRVNTDGESIIINPIEVKSDERID